MNPPKLALATKNILKSKLTSANAQVLPGVYKRGTLLCFAEIHLDHIASQMGEIKLLVKS